MRQDPAAASVESEVDNDATEEEQEEESHSDSDEKRNGWGTQPNNCCGVAFTSCF